ncbi:MAG: prepilin-type N-terminal cleavage/methylation domain-containing protein, partial [Acinetobacter sp.]
TLYPFFYGAYLLCIGSVKYKFNMNISKRFFRCKTMENNRGFTLVELTVTIAVLATVMVMAIPSMQNLIAKQQLNTTARDLAYVFSQARGQAAALRKNVTVKFAVNTAPTNIYANAVTYFWLPKYDDISLTSIKDDVVFLPIGLVTMDGRTQEEIPNPAFDSTKPEDPLSNPKKIKRPVPLVFTVCSSKLNASKAISISKTGVIEKIEDKTGAC